MSERRCPSRSYEVLVQRERWRKVTPGKSALCPALDWCFASTVHYGETLAWSARTGDERGTAGPFDSKEEAIQHAEEFWGCARQEIEVAEEPADACARCGLSQSVHGHGETGREDSHPFEPIP